MTSTLWLHILQSGISLEWMPINVTWASSVSKNEKFSPPCWLIILVTEGLCITYAGARAQWFKYIDLPLMQVISLTVIFLYGQLHVASRNVYTQRQMNYNGLYAEGPKIDLSSTNARTNWDPNNAFPWGVRRHASFHHQSWAKFAKLAFGENATSLTYTIMRSYGTLQVRIVYHARYL